jgi:phosphate transport system protein
MPRETFERGLQSLQDDLLHLGSRVEQALVRSVQLLKEQDLEGARRLVARDRELNRMRFDIEDQAFILIATQGPMARDMRTVAATLAIVGELERIGDYAKGIGKITLLLGHEPLIKPLIDIPRMAEKAQDMLHRALDAFTRRDADAARALPAQDDEIDDLYNQVYRELMTFVVSDPSTIDQANYLLWAAHNLERAADRVVNICERIVFTVTGELLELGAEEGETAVPEVREGLNER